MADGVGSGTSSFFPGRRGFASAAVALVVVLAAGPVSAFDPTAYRQLLAEYVHPGRIGDVPLHVVEYAALRRDPLYRDALAEFAGADPRTFPDREARFAFWINAYNLMAIRVVVEHYPLGGIRDAGNVLWPVWKRRAGVVAGRERSLDDIEHGILRPVFRDPRAHFAIVCASVSCPDLSAEPYDGARLSAQLDAAVRAFLSNQAKGLSLPVAPPSGRGAATAGPSGTPATAVSVGPPSVSSIFRWFAEDFAAAGGVLGFVRSKADPDVAAAVAGFTDADLRWLDYDWSLNDAARSR